MDTYPDIDRLEKVGKLIDEIFKITYHMDGAEYTRARPYILSRWGVTLPFDEPSHMTVPLKKTNQ